MVTFTKYNQNQNVVCTVDKLVHMLFVKIKNDFFF